MSKVIKGYLLGDEVPDGAIFISEVTTTSEITPNWTVFYFLIEQPAMQQPTKEDK